MMYLENLRYLLRHKWFVFLECQKAGIAWRGLMHDMSKFRPCEFIPYARYFFGKEAGTTGYCHSPGYNDEFDLAWLKHQKCNLHHWQWHVLREDDGGTKALKMPHVYMVEMLCDWKGAGKAQGFMADNDCLKWYTQNRNKMTLHYETRSWIEAELGYTEELS